jgi:predicted Zn-dependent protease
MRPILAAASLTLALAAVPAGPAPAQDTRLPDIGSSAATVISPSEQAEYGAMMLSQLRYYGYTLEDPLLLSWLQAMGQRLAASSDDPRQPFTFFLLGDRQINAFATLGGYIGVNAGLVLAADREDGVAAVLSHEIAHVTQAHVLRAVEAAERDRIPIMLAMLGAIAVAQSAGGNSADDATMAALTSAQGLMAQRMIDYTRGNEAEADRIGIRTLSRAGYDVDAMAGFFQTLQASIRSNISGSREGTPDYLQTHPVTTSRISEARERARQIAEAPRGYVPTPTPRDNLLLPSSLRIAAAPAGQGPTGLFPWARERLRVLSADTPAQAIREYGQMGELDDAQRYGLAVAHYLDGKPAAAAAMLEELLAAHPGDTWLELALAQAQAHAGDTAAADARFEALAARMPSSRPVALTYAGILNERKTRAAGQRAQALLRPLLAGASADPVFQQTFARASEIAGEPVRAGEAYAEAAFHNGRAEQALLQLNTHKRRDDLDYYARARIDARIAQITPVVLELHRQGIRDEDLDR